MVVEEGKEEDLALPVRMGRVGQIGTIHGIPLPQLTKVGAFKAAIGPGALLGEELGSGGAPSGEVAAQRAWGDACLSSRMCLVERKDADDRARGTEWLLAFERFCAVEGLGGKRPGLTAVRAGLGLESLKTFLLVDALPTSKRGCADRVPGRVGNVVMLGGDLATQLLLAPGWVLATQQGQDESVAKEGDRGALVGVGHGCLL